VPRNRRREDRAPRNRRREDRVGPRRRHRRSKLRPDPRIGVRAGEANPRTEVPALQLDLQARVRAAPVGRHRRVGPVSRRQTTVPAGPRRIMVPVGRAGLRPTEVVAGLRRTEVVADPQVRGRAIVLHRGIDRRHFLLLQRRIHSGGSCPTIRRNRSRRATDGCFRRVLPLRRPFSTRANRSSRRWTQDCSSGDSRSTESGSRSTLPAVNACSTTYSSSLSGEPIRQPDGHGYFVADRSRRLRGPRGGPLRSRKHGEPPVTVSRISRSTAS
jgi:hypothetical protein